MQKKRRNDSSGVLICKSQKKTLKLSVPAFLYTKNTKKNTEIDSFGVFIRKMQYKNAETDSLAFLYIKSKKKRGANCPGIFYIKN